MIKYIYASYYRKPYPSGNWCPRIEFVYNLDKEIIAIQHNNKGQLLHELHEKHGCNWSDILIVCDDIELSVENYNRMAKLHKTDFNLIGVKS